MKDRDLLLQEALPAISYPVWPEICNIFFDTLDLWITLLSLERRHASNTCFLN